MLFSPSYNETPVIHRHPSTRFYPEFSGLLCPDMRHALTTLLFIRTINTVWFKVTGQLYIDACLIAAHELAHETGSACFQLWDDTAIIQIIWNKKMHPAQRNWLCCWPQHREGYLKWPGLAQGFLESILQSRWTPAGSDQNLNLILGSSWQWATRKPTVRRKMTKAFPVPAPRNWWSEVNCLWTWRFFIAVLANSYWGFYHPWIFGSLLQPRKLVAISESWAASSTDNLSSTKKTHKKHHGDRTLVNMD